ncbi:MAG TPA: agmatinase [Solirubrobacteraceae bacterium]|jgi:agmatinase|nr:agmatinase [Solirubrobacteraceae bacterium]
MRGIRTFGGLPHHLIVEGFDVAIVGVPWDGGASRRPGARFGPEAIRHASTTLERYHPTYQLDLFQALRAVDWGDVEMVPGDALRAFDEIEGELTVFLGAGATPIVLGGDHTILEGELSALASVVGPVALVMLDAHTDTLEEPDEDRTSRGGALRRAVVEGIVRPEQSLLAGLRGPLTGPLELEWPKAVGFELISCAELVTMAPEEFGRRVRERVGDAPVHLSVDLDVVDPAFAPATGTPEIGGLTSAQLVALLRGLAGIPFRGYDVAELTPAYDTEGQTTALLAANVVFEFLGLAATALAGGA